MAGAWITDRGSFCKLRTFVIPDFLKSAQFYDTFEAYNKSISCSHGASDSLAFDNFDRSSVNDLNNGIPKIRDVSRFAIILLLPAHSEPGLGLLLKTVQDQVQVQVEVQVSR